MNITTIHKHGVHIMLPSRETDHLLIEAETAKILSVEKSTLRRWRWAGEGPKFIKLGSAVRYDPEELRDYLAKQVRSSTSDPGTIDV